MIAVLKSGTSQKQLDNLTSWLKAQGLDVHISVGNEHTVVGLIGDTSRIDEELLGSLLTRLATLSRELIVELLGAIGRCITINVDVLLDAVVRHLLGSLLLECGKLVALLSLR